MTEIDVVLIPGFLCDERVFAPQIEALGALDIVRSVDVADITTADSIEAMADAVVGASPERFAVIGLSLGAIVAAEIASRAPDRLVGLAALSTNLGPPAEAQIRQRTGWHQDVLAGRLDDVIRRDLVEPLTVDVDAHRDLIVDMARRAGADTFLQQNTALLHRRDRRDDLAALPAPVLIACGRDDQLCPPSVHDDLARRTPGARLAVIEGAGHLSTIDRPHELNDVVGGWLRGCENTPPLPTGGTSNAYITT